MRELRLQGLIQPHASLSRLILRHLAIISKADDDEGRAAAGTEVWDHSQASCYALYSRHQMHAVQEASIHTFLSGIAQQGTRYDPVINSRYSKVLLLHAQW